MAFKLTWMPTTLLDAGLKVAEVDGWPNRGRAEMGEVLGVMLHHTAGPRSGNMPSLRTLIDGRPDLSGPLSQLGLGRDGTFYVIAAGRANHAGAGEWQGVSAGNSSFIGIECENTGKSDDSPWPEVQLDALARGVAVLLKKLDRKVIWCVGHKEYALPKGRKPDPDFDMDAFRERVKRLMDPATPPAVLIPAVEPKPPAGVVPRPTLRRGDRGEAVRALQTLLGIAPADGSFGPITEAKLRAWQAGKHLVPDGIVGPKTWAMLSR